MNEERNQAIKMIRLNLQLPEDPNKADSLLNFQNQVLRPILKFQNGIIQDYFSEYYTSRKFDLKDKSRVLLDDFVRQSFKADRNLKQFYLGLICGLFQKQEFEYYLRNKREINKRIISMLIQRVQSNLQLVSGQSNQFL